MNGRHVWTVFAKEMVDTLRDRRTWLAMIILPLLLVPVLLTLLPSVLERQTKQLEARPPVLAVQGGTAAPGLMAYLADAGRLEVRNVDDAAAEVQSGQAGAGLVVPDDFEARLEAETPARLSLLYDASSQKSAYAAERAQRLLQAYGQVELERRLAARGLDPALLLPVELAVTNVAPEERVGATYLSFIMPLLLASWAALGGMYAAIDVAAGEKERGTLEPLLATGPSRLSLVTGKFLAVTITSLVASIIARLGMYISFLVKPEALLGPGAGDTLRFSVPVLNALLMTLVALSLAAIFGALQLAVSLFARSFKEAQTYLSPLSLVIVVPAVLTQTVPAQDASLRVFFVPLLNALFAFKELTVGIVNWTHLSVTLSVSAALVVASLGLAVRAFNSERVIFRT